VPVIVAHCLDASSMIANTNAAALFYISPVKRFGY